MDELKKKISVIIDTDPGVDDAASILWVLASGIFDVKALTIANGNVGLKQCAKNALKILEISGRTDIPVFIGAERPLIRKTVDAAWVHGSDGLGDAGYPDSKAKAKSGYASTEMIRIAKESEEPITILALAPLTNIALALLLDPCFKDQVKQILFMGGAVRVPGNDFPVSSFNVGVDPEAAKLVYNSGIPVVQLGLDVCDKVRQTNEDLTAIANAGTRVGDFLIGILRFMRERAAVVVKDAEGNIVKQIKVSSETGEIGLNDLTCTAYLIEPQWFKTQPLTIDIDTTGLCPGQTVADFRGLWGRKPNVSWAYEVDSRAAMKQWVSDMCSFDPRT